MSAFDSPPQPRKGQRSRSNGWTAERQLRFLDVLAESRSVSAAAAFAGLSRESAYRLRNRSDGRLFALLWDRLLEPAIFPTEVHTSEATTAEIMRVLGVHFRRERGDFLRNASIARRAR